MRYISTQHTHRTGVAGLLIVFALLMTACTGRGGGRLGAPLEGSPTFDGPATFGFTFTCEVCGGNAVIRGQFEYHDDAVDYDMHGVVDPLFTTVETCEAAAAQLEVQYTHVG